MLRRQKSIKKLSEQTQFHAQQEHSNNTDGSRSSENCYHFNTQSKHSRTSTRTLKTNTHNFCLKNVSRNKKQY